MVKAVKANSIEQDGGHDFQAEPLVELAKRYQAAVLRPINLETEERDQRWKDRRYIFDFPEGVRLIVNREEARDGRYLHLSAALVPATRLMQLFEDIQRVNAEYGGFAGCYPPCVKGRLEALFCGMAEQRFRKISGDSRPLWFLGITISSELPHWVIIETPNTPQSLLAMNAQFRPVA